MVDSRSNKSQRYFIQQQVKQSMPEIRCKHHPSSNIEAFNLDINSDHLLVCMKCAITNSLNNDQLVILEEIFSQENRQIVKNWPPLQNQEVIKKLKNNQMSESKKQELIIQMSEIFNAFKKDLLQIVIDHETRAIENINMMQEVGNEAIQIYNEISGKEDIKKSILQKYNNLDELEAYLKRVISDKQKQSKENEIKIQNTLDKLITQNDCQQIEDLLQSVLKQIQSIDFLNPLYQIEKQQQSSQTEKNVQSLINKQQQIVVDSDSIPKQTQNKNINQQDLLQNIEIIKSEFGKENMFYKKTDLNQIQIEHDEDNMWGQVVLLEKIIPQKKYLIQVELMSQQKNNEHVMLGLLPADQVHQLGHINYLTLWTTSNQFGISKIEQGIKIEEIKKDIKLITFQINLSQNILRCMAVVNNQKNIYSLLDWNYVKQNQHYYFFNALFLGDTKIIIKEFKIVDQFEQW